MKENPYSSLIEIMQKESNKKNIPTIKIGKVVYIEETEDKILNIKIEIDDLVLDRDNLYISEDLLKSCKRKIKITKIDNKKEVYKEDIKIENKDIDIVYVEGIKKGDLVAVMPVENRQIYIVLCKVVSVNE